MTSGWLSVSDTTSFLIFQKVDIYIIVNKNTGATLVSPISNLFHYYFLLIPEKAGFSWDIIFTNIYQ